ncbi:MAG TPA: hypothetical protein VHQ90_02940 [Thermoanaerobaculia bacterium]|nr:hypothetical protein [Thermoanaerobaculia bacterium]
MPKRAQLARSIAIGGWVLLIAATASAYSAMKLIDDFKDATSTRVFKHDIDQHGAHVRVGLKLTSGKAAATLRDGSGAEVWRQDFKPGKLVGEADIDGKPGTWQVELALEHATGRYSIGLKNR